MDITHYVNTMSSNKIEAIISKNELIDLLERDLIKKHKFVLISISEPSENRWKDDTLSDTHVDGFKDSLRVKFWDIEEDISNYKVIPDDVAKEIQDFIIRHKDDTFIVHCKAGQSRSAGVGKAIECITNFGVGDESKYLYQTGFSSEIDKNARYSPNLTVFDKIVKEE